MAIDKYLQLITSEHFVQPRYIDWVTAHLVKANVAVTLANNLSDFFDIDLASGKQLDILGQLVGIRRRLDFQPDTAPAVLDDETYRLVLRAKIIRNQWDGTREGMVTLWKTIFPDEVLILVDNQDMSMDVLVPTFGENPLWAELIEKDYVIPRPMAVMMYYSITPLPFFAYAVSDEYSQGLGGYNYGTWLEVKR